MKTSVENIGNNVVKLRIEIDAEAFSAAVVKYTLNSSVKLIKEIKFQVEALIPGFETKYHLSTYQFKQ